MIRSAGPVAIAALVIGALSVNIFPVITNDSVTYIGFSRDVGAFGLVHVGYRQVGYPLYLMVERLTSGVVGIEPLLFSALSQRLLLAVGVAYGIWLWRWRAAPVVLLVASPSLLAYTNFMLIEGLSMPLALIAACSVSHHFKIVQGTCNSDRPMLPAPAAHWSKATIAAVTALTATAISFALLTVRYPFAVFGVIPLLLFVAALRRSESKTRPYAVMLTVYLVAAGVFSMAMAQENSDELGVFTPSARGERSQYWSAWQVTFVLHPENKQRQELADFYDDGTPYPAIWEIEQEHPAYPDQATQFESAIDDMLTAASLDANRERLFSFLGAIRGGRIDDVKGIVEAMLDADASRVDQVIHRNTFSRTEGHDVFNNRFNDGHRPQAAITSPIFPRPPLPYFSTTLGLLLPVALVGMLVMAMAKRQLLQGATFLIPTMVYAAALGWLLADNVRFLVTTSVYGVAGVCALWDSSQHREDLSIRPQ